MADGVVHIEIPVKNLKETSEFYSTVFGWELTPVPNHEYILFTADGAGISGAFIKPDVHQVGGTVAYIQIENIENALETIGENSGQALSGRQEVGDAGWFAMFTDPDGNPMGLWENRTK